VKSSNAVSKMGSGMELVGWDHIKAALLRSEQTAHLHLVQAARTSSFVSLKRKYDGQWAPAQRVYHSSN
jgi:hypothetical protein